MPGLLLPTLGGIVPTLAAVLTPAAAVLVTVAQKLAKLAKASVGEATWTATLKKYSSKAVLYLAALIVPLLLWVTYIYLSYWAIRIAMEDGCGAATPIMAARHFLLREVPPASHPAGSGRSARCISQSRSC